MAKKMTIAEKFAEVIRKAQANEPLTAEDITFLTERKAQAEKKNTDRKPTKTQTENADIKVAILDFMEPGKAYTVSEVQKGVGIVTNQKTSALMRQLKEDNLIVRSVEKGKAYFTKAE